MKKQLLDPLGTLCRLVALYFNEVHTKISIQDHILKLQEPSGLQAMVRFYNGDARENISELYYVVARIIKWYLILEDDDGENENNRIISQSPEFRGLVAYLCAALRKLQETYIYGNVILAIQFYINVLEDALNNNYTNQKLPQFLSIEEDNLLDYDKLKNLWSMDDIKRIYDSYKYCFDLMEQDDKHIGEHDKIRLINGCMQSINAVLDINGKKFQELVQNSNKG